MKDRIKKIMDAENISPAHFADKLEIGRAVISHILNGRNNPSLEVVSKILLHLPNINSEWLLTGNGEMYKINLTENKSTTEKINDYQTDLFAQSFINATSIADTIEYRKENVVDNTKKTSKISEIETINHEKKHTRNITKIIIYYSDNTFETFDPNK